MKTNEKTRLREVPIEAHSIDRFLPLLGEEQIRDADKLGRDVSKRLDGRALWNVNSTASGGGVAEILRSVLPYVRELGIDARWLIINVATHRTVATSMNQMERAFNIRHLRLYR